MNNYFFGYARISTNKQDFDRQINNILNFESKAVIYKEIASRYDLKHRNVFNNLLIEVMKLKKEGNNVTIICDAVDRFGSDDDCFILYKQLFDLEIDVIFLKESYASTTFIREKLNKSKIPRTNSPMDYIIEGIEKYLYEITFLEVQSAFKQSQIEIVKLKERVIDGINLAKKRGKTIGRPKLTKDDIPDSFYKNLDLYNKKAINKSEFARLMNWSRPKLDRMLKLYKK